jgi:hypothetical protein
MTRMTRCGSLVVAGALAAISLGSPRAASAHPKVDLDSLSETDLRAAFDYELRNVDKEHVPASEADLIASITAALEDDGDGDDDPKDIISWAELEDEVDEDPEYPTMAAEIQGIVHAAWQKAHSREMSMMRSMYGQIRDGFMRVVLCCPKK